MNPNWIAAVFVVLLSLALVVYRKRFTFHSFMKIFYFCMLRTKIGIKLMDKWAVKYRGILLKSCYVMIGLGFIGMALVSFELIRGLIKLIVEPSIMAVGLVLPFQAKGIFYVPLAYWLLAVAFVIVVHEFSHGLIARLHKLRVKSTGLAFLGVLIPIIPGAFVEPDEKKLQKASVFKQLSVFAAGPFANILFGTVFALLFFFILTPLNAALYTHNGVAITGYITETSPAAINGLAVGDVITKIDGIAIEKIADFSAAFEGKAAGDRMQIVTSSAIHDLALAERSGDAFLGVYVSENKQLAEAVVANHGVAVPTLLSWFIQLIYWLAILNLGVGLFNLVPLGPLDGGRMFHTVIHRWLHKERATTVWKAVSYMFLFVIISSLLFGFLA